MKKSKDYWMRQGSVEEGMDYFQQLIVKESLNSKNQSAFSSAMPSPVVGSTPREVSPVTGSPAEVLERRIMRGGSMMEENTIQQMEEFQNLLPIINASQTQSDYLGFVLSFITENLTDLSAITNILDISKFSQQRRMPLIEEFAIDNNMRDIVEKLYRFKEDMHKSDKMKQLESEMHREKKTVVVSEEISEGKQVVYKSVPQEYFRKNYEPDLVLLLADKEKIKEKVAEMEATRKEVENSRLIELTDKFDVFLEMMTKLGQMDSIIKQQIEVIGQVRKKNIALANRTSTIKESIISKVRQKEVYHKALVVAQAILLFRDCHNSFVHTSSEYDYNRMCNLASKCDQLFDTQLREVKVIQFMKTDIDSTKQNFQSRLKTAASDVLGAQFSTILNSKPQEEIEKAKAVSTKVLQEALINRSFATGQELLGRASESMKEFIRLSKMSLSTKPQPSVLKEVITTMLSTLSQLEDTLGAVIYGIFFLRVDSILTREST